MLYALEVSPSKADRANGEAMVSPRFSTHNSIARPKIALRICAKRELKSILAKSPAWIVQKEQVIEVAHRPDTLVLKEGWYL
jgi:hypothetical protein